MQKDQRQPPSFLNVIKKIHCPKHNQPIVLVCIEKQCPQLQRTFCFQCNDEAQLNKNTHLLISTKKFDSMHIQYKQNLKAKSNRQPHQRLAKLKQSLLNKFNQIQSLLISPSNQQQFVEGQQEQIMKGKLNNLLKNNIWTKILDMKNSKIVDQKIYSSLNQESQSKNKLSLQLINNLQNSLLMQFQSVITSFKTSKAQNFQPYVFSSQRKNTNLKLSKDRKNVSNQSQNGHYFCLTQKDFDIYNTCFKFNIGKIQESVSYWFGFTFPSMSQNKKWTNIYDPGLGGFFIVIFDNLQKIKFWNHQKVMYQNGQQLPHPVVNSYNTIQLTINFQAKQLSFYLSSQGKRTFLKSIKPQKWYGKIYPVVGFYGKNGNISIQ